MVDSIVLTQDPLTVTDDAVREALRRIVARSSFAPSVYRLQMSASFGFVDAAALAPYFQSLGVQALYFSPYLESVPGSTHGYNVTDPNRLNPEIGTEEDFDHLALEMERRSLKHVADIVPNHMGVEGSSNHYWMDVLENGVSSIYASFFDIDWDPPKTELKNKTLIPILGDLYGRVLEAGEIRLLFSQGEFQVAYANASLPLAPDSYPSILEGHESLEGELGPENPAFLELQSVVTSFRNLPPRGETDPDKIRERHREKEIAKRRLGDLAGRSESVRRFIDGRMELLNGQKGQPRTFDALDRLLNDQAYRMAHWAVASEEINYRRFFNINELAALRIEDESVFRRVHALVFRLIREKKIHGVRVDHPDGLYDPPTYFERLQKEFFLQSLLAEFPAAQDDEQAFRERLEPLLAEEEFVSAKPLPVVVEKILDRKEELPAGWNVHGTVGYDFLNVLNGIFVDASNAEAIESIYRAFIGHAIDIDELVYDAKKLFAVSYMSSELNALGHRLDRISEKNRRFRDFTRHSLTRAIREVIQCFPVYRTYLTPSSPVASERDERYIRMAVRKAKKRGAEINPAIYDFLQSVLLLEIGSEVGKQEAAEYRDFVLRFQQLTGPIMAKGLEDTAFFVNNRLISLNEVGGDPSHFGVTPEDFHRHNARQNASWPAGFVTTSTHDTKRGADARFRLDVLSEIPSELKTAIARWSAMNARHKTELEGVLQPRPNTEYYVYQSLLAAWPDGGWNADVERTFLPRFLSAVEKSVREAKIYTSWISPDADYEATVERFIKGALSGKEFFADFATFQKKISRLGKYNSLSALTLKLASPGIVDTYQGEELWDYSLVDPDNRRPVDFTLRQKYLEELSGGCIDPAALYAKMDDGRIKLYVLSHGLKLRAANPGLFVGGDYRPLEIRGRHATRAVAFARTYEGVAVLAAASRLHAGFGESAPVGGVWEDTEIVLPEGGEWLDVLGRRTLEAKVRTLKLSEVFGQLNAALLKGKHS